MKENQVLMFKKLKTFEGNYDNIFDYLFNNWVITQNEADNVSTEIALKIAIYAI
jgi:hypothetical protein